MARLLPAHHRQARRHALPALGLQEIQRPWQRDAQAFEAWCEGAPASRSSTPTWALGLSGFLEPRPPDRGELPHHNLGIDWRWGAEWFEACLVDHDVASNWGNWNYAAGVGNDARGFRYFDIATQASKYDRRGATRACGARSWPVPDRLVHAPWDLTRAQQDGLGLHLGQMASPPRRPRRQLAANRSGGRRPGLTEPAAGRRSSI